MKPDAKIEMMSPPDNYEGDGGSTPELDECTCSPQRMGPHVKGCPSEKYRKQCGPDHDCDAWALNSEMLDGVVMSAYAHGVQYKGQPFIFCPWCGKRRT